MSNLDLYMLFGRLNHEMDLKSMCCGRDQLPGWDLYDAIYDLLAHSVTLQGMCCDKSKQHGEHTYYSLPHINYNVDL